MGIAAGTREGTLVAVSSALGCALPGSLWRMAAGVLSKDCVVLQLEQNIADLIAEIVYLHFILVQSEKIVWKTKCLVELKCSFSDS